MGIYGVPEKAIVGVALAAGTALLSQFWISSGRVWVKGGAGRTCVSPKLLLVGLIALGVAGMAASLPFTSPQMLQKPGAWPLWGLMLCLLSYGFIMPFLIARHSWEWDEKGLTWHRNLNSVSIPWADIESIHRRWWDRKFFAVSKSGVTIAWPEIILQHAALRRAIAKARPDLLLPDTETI